MHIFIVQLGLIILEDLKILGFAFNSFFNSLAFLSNPFLISYTLKYISFIFSAFSSSFKSSINYLFIVEPP